MLIIVIVLTSENRIIDISASENNSTVTNNVVNRLIGENRVNISNFLNNECMNVYKINIWHGYLLYNFFLGGRDAEIIDQNYEKE